MFVYFFKKRESFLNELSFVLFCFICLQKTKTKTFFRTEEEETRERAIVFVHVLVVIFLGKERRDSDFSGGDGDSFDRRGEPEP